MKKEKKMVKDKKYWERIEEIRELMKSDTHEEEKENEENHGIQKAAEKFANGSEILAS